MPLQLNIHFSCFDFLALYFCVIVRTYAQHRISLCFISRFLLGPPSILILFFFQEELHHACICTNAGVWGMAGT